MMLLLLRSPTGQSLEFLNDENRLVVGLPMSNISQVALPGKGEVDVQFFDDDTGERGGGWCFF